MTASGHYIKFTKKSTRGNVIGSIYLKLSRRNIEKRGHVFLNYSLAILFEISNNFLKSK